MEISMTFDILCCKLNNLYHLVPSRGFTGNRKLKNVRTGSRFPCDREYLYILTKEEYLNSKKTYHGCSLLVCGYPDTDRAQAEELTDNVVFIKQSAETELSFHEVFNDVLTVFADFYEWRELLHQSDLNRETASRILSFSTAYTEMELFICDGFYQTDFSSLSENTRQNDPFGILTTPPDEVSSILNTQPEFAESFHTRKVCSYPSPYKGLLYYYNFFCDDQYLGRLLAVFPEQTFVSGRVRLLEYTASFAERAYLRHYSQSGHLRRDTRFLKTLEGLLTGTFQDDISLQNALNSFGWQLHHNYQVLRLEITEHGNSISRTYLCADFEQNFPTTCALQIQEQVVCIRNLSLEPANLPSGKRMEKSASNPNNNPDFNQKLPYFLRDNLCRAGISNCINDIHKLHLLYMEAGDALRLGKQKHSTFWYYHFHDYALDYLKDRSISQYPADQLEHKALGILRGYDTANHCALYETLQMFVRQRFSASASASALFIHRSTFLHRLNRIQELTEIDFSDETTRVWLTISFFIQKRDT